MPTSHTPTPWFVNDKLSNGDIEISPKDSPRVSIAFVQSNQSCDGQRAKDFPAQDEAEANAAFIVQAINCHDDLVDALVAALPFLEDALTDEAYKKEWVAQNVKKVRAALAKAGEA